jgi:hypothetical protein
MSERASRTLVVTLALLPSAAAVALYGFAAAIGATRGEWPRTGHPDAGAFEGWLTAIDVPCLFCC